MRVCAYCAKPVEIEVLFRPAMDAHWILYYDGFGVNRKEVEVFGDSRQEAVSRFREAWIKVFDRELCKPDSEKTIEQKILSRLEKGGADTSPGMAVIQKLPGWLRM